MVNKWSINRVQQNAGDYGKQQVKKQKVLPVPNKNTMILQSIKLNIVAKMSNPQVRKKLSIGLPCTRRVRK
jgi:hypothetical protein